MGPAQPGGRCDAVAKVLAETAVWSVGGFLTITTEPTDTEGSHTPAGATGDPSRKLLGLLEELRASLRHGRSSGLWEWWTIGCGWAGSAMLMVQNASGGVGT